jgi:hypothetical protein
MGATHGRPATCCRVAVLAVASESYPACHVSSLVTVELTATLGSIVIEPFFSRSARPASTRYRAVFTFVKGE